MSGNTPPKNNGALSSGPRALGQHWKLLASAHHLIHSLKNCKLCRPAGDIERYRLPGNAGFCRRDKVASLQCILCIAYICDMQVMHIIHICDMHCDMQI